MKAGGHRFPRALTLLQPGRVTDVCLCCLGGGGGRSAGQSQVPNTALPRIPEAPRARCRNAKRTSTRSSFHPSEITTVNCEKHISRGVSACENKWDFTVLKHAFFISALERCSQYVTFCQNPLLKCNSGCVFLFPYVPLSLSLRIGRGLLQTPSLSENVHPGRSGCLCSPEPSRGWSGFFVQRRSSLSPQVSAEAVAGGPASHQRGDHVPQ